MTCSWKSWESFRSKWGSQNDSESISRATRMLLYWLRIWAHSYLEILPSSSWVLRTIPRQPYFLHGPDLFRFLWLETVSMPKPIGSPLYVMDRDNVLRTEQTAQGGSDGRKWQMLRIWSDIMTVLEVMQKKIPCICCLLFDTHHSFIVRSRHLNFFRTVNLEFKPRILYTCKEKHKIWAGVITNLKNLRSFITSCSHLKIYVSSQESNEMQHSEVKWSFLMCQDSHVDFFFSLTSRKQSQRNMMQPSH